jgi:hypothetical protein
LLGIDERDCAQPRLLESPEQVRQHFENDRIACRRDHRIAIVQQQDVAGG